VALFRATAVPECLPFRAFPSSRSRAPLGVASSLAVIHPSSLTHRSRSCHRWFPPLPRSHAFAWFPQRLWVPFSRAEARFPVPLDLPRHERHVRLASPTSKPCSLYESVRVQLGLPLTDGRYSRVFSPLKSSPTTSRSLDPPRPRGPEHSPSPLRLRPEELRLATKRTSKAP